MPYSPNARSKLPLKLSELIAASRRGARRLAAEAEASLVPALQDFGDNPGQLRALTHVPAKRQAKAPLVVVLHGCGQTAQGYDAGTGWTQMADRHGFVVLLPEQQRSNNPNTCFSWFDPNHASRDQGEVASIRQMIAHLVAAEGVDPDRVFVTGLSAGGAMAASLLATYPEVFAGGAVIAGLPHGAATSVQEAFAAMSGVRDRTDQQWGDLVRGASNHSGPWPVVSIWHGGADRTVAPANAEALARQWLDVHGLGDAAGRVRTIAGAAHTAWHGPDGVLRVEMFEIPGMAHGTPIAPHAEEHPGGTPAPFILDAGINSTWHIADRWGLTGVEFAQTAARAPAARAPGAPPPAPQASPAPANDPRPTESGITATINKALRAAGLM
ncbi:poly(hydroxyalkanoate) depolymerase family esterase [Humitalea rosea]|uniref:Poly(Hydroxyalkanoate) depolymerase family esterase n=1 Tax=Humitalea rosea TaxID=990373 RepID=A0A2W7IAL1_9PROT|nr:PHB depolymerase family esterase [Humitalea rosea]PZW43148.1 poly(hydroxyalkanoate) depolymerase family esterase [Humitalea rosea]